MYFAKHITIGRCVDDIMYINLLLFESESNSVLYIYSIFYTGAVLRSVCCSIVK